MPPTAFHAAIAASKSAARFEPRGAEHGRHAELSGGCYERQQHARENGRRDQRNGDVQHHLATVEPAHVAGLLEHRVHVVKRARGEDEDVWRVEEAHDPDDAAERVEVDLGQPQGRHEEVERADALLAEQRPGERADERGYEERHHDADAQQAREGNVGADDQPGHEHADETGDDGAERGNLDRMPDRLQIAGVCQHAAEILERNAVRLVAERDVRQRAVDEEPQRCQHHEAKYKGENREQDGRDA